jgi:hypothetical protein
MRGDGRLWDTCELQRSRTASTEGVAGVLVGLLMENVTDPPTDAADEGGVGQWSVGASLLEEEGEMRLTSAGWEQRGVRGVRGHWAQDVIPTDDSNCGGDE